MAVRILPADKGMAEAVERLHRGMLVAFPTETVYGLGADARNPEAVARIFAAKGRPATNPLIVHVASKDVARQLSSFWSPIADSLARAHWPGPLTIVVTKTEAIPPIVTAGGNTIGLRVPDHPVALKLLRLSGVPIAAPSANRSEEISPTAAQHVADSLGPYVDDLLVLDGGPCNVGIESTVVDATRERVRVLRPGMIGIISASPSLPDDDENDGVSRSPGQMLRHYAPSKPLFLVTTEEELQRLYREGDTVVVADMYPALVAQGLYAQLRELDSNPAVERILYYLPVQTPEWEAIHDRLRRAATPKSSVE